LAVFQVAVLVLLLMKFLFQIVHTVRTVGSFGFTFNEGTGNSIVNYQHLEPRKLLPTANCFLPTLFLLTNTLNP